jgi:uncharacterized protein with PIN domain
VRSASFRFHAELRDLLEQGAEDGIVPYRFNGTPAVKDAVEAIGVPHVEVERIEIEGIPVGFEQRLGDGDRIDVFPASMPGSRASGIALRPPLAGRPRFVLDGHLGTLARRLRLLGFDAVYRNEIDDAEVVEISVAEGRIALSRDRGLLKRGRLQYGYCLRSEQTARQLDELTARYDLRAHARPFSRCIACNGRLQPVDKQAVLERLPERTRREHDEFRRCDGCGKLYWRGSHYGRLLARVERWLAGP